MADNAVAEPAEAEESKRRATDPELLRINRIMREMDECDEQGQRRIMWYLSMRYAGVAIIQSRSTSTVSEHQ